MSPSYKPAPQISKETAGQAAPNLQKASKAKRIFSMCAGWSKLPVQQNRTAGASPAPGAGVGLRRGANRDASTPVGIKTTFLLKGRRNDSRYRLAAMQQRLFFARYLVA